MAGLMGYMPPTEGYEIPKPAPSKPYPDTLIGTADVAPLLNLLSELPHGAPIAVDTETTGLFPYEDDVIRGVSIAFKTPSREQPVQPPGSDEYEPVTPGPEFDYLHSFYIPVGYPNASDNLSTQSQQMLFQAIKDLDPFLILHHGKFDFAFLRQLPMTKDGGVYFPTPLAGDCEQAPHWWDTKVVAWLLDENMPTGLKEQAAFHFGEDSKDEQAAIKKLVRVKGWDGLNPEDTACYAAKDAELTLRLYERQQGLIDHPSTLGDIRPAIARELAIQGVLGRMEATGILVNPTLLQEMTESTARRIGEIEASFVINLRSPKQLREYLAVYGMEVTSTARDKLEAIDPPTPEAKAELDLILEHRRLQKAASGYLAPLKVRLGRDGRVHAGFSSTGTVTGRFSCSNPNLQTIPRSDTLVGVRDLFIPEPGFDLWEFDLQAAEMRVMAGMAGDENLMRNLDTEGWDPHSELAAEVFGPNFTGLQRRYSKNLRYGWQYGLTSVRTAAKYIKGANGEKVAGKILAGLKKLHPCIFQLMNRTTRQAEKNGYVPIHETAWPGRYRRFRTPSARRSPAYTSLNAQVQGGIGELMKDVMLSAEESLNYLGARICLQVHDALVIEVPEGYDEMVHESLQMHLDDGNPFDMRMIFSAQLFGAHE